MIEKARFRLWIGTVYGLEAEIVQDLLELSAVTGENFGIVKKHNLAGPNDIIYLLADVDYWKEFLPWASAAIAGGALGAVGRRVFERYFPSQDSKTVAQIDRRQESMGYQLDKIFKNIDQIERYHNSESEIRIGYSISPGPGRGDPGVLIENSRDLPLAIVMLVVAGERVMALLTPGDSDERASGVSYPTIFIADNFVKIRYTLNKDGRREVVEEHI